MVDFTTLQGIFSPGFFAGIMKVSSLQHNSIKALNTELNDLS